MNVTNSVVRPTGDGEVLNRTLPTALPVFGRIVFPPFALGFRPHEDSHRMIHHRRKRGFTLAEMLVTVSIIAVLAAVIVPSSTRRFS